MKRALLALTILTGSACSGVDANTAGSSSGSTSASGLVTGASGTNGIQAIGAVASTSGTAASGNASSGSPTGASNSNSNASSNSSSAATVSSSGTSRGASASGTASGSTAGVGSSSGSACLTNEFAGIGNSVACCSGTEDAQGFCIPVGGTSGTSGTGTSSSGTATTVAATTVAATTVAATTIAAAGSSSGTTGLGTGTTTGGTCPVNMPNLATGDTTTVGGACSVTGDPCPTGFSCINRKCELHGSNGQLQITMSWDYPEDLDLHVREPQGGGDCEIFYGNIGPRQYTDGGLDPSGFSPNCTPVGWLDRDSNPACNLDNVDIENVIYPPNVTPPSGTYSVYTDFWEDCSDVGLAQSYTTIPYAVQVRRNGQVFVYCSSFAGGTSDSGGLGSGGLITTFTLP